jgi:hypothetical protein
VAEVSLAEELLAEAGCSLWEEEEVVRKLFGDPAYQSEQLQEELSESGILLVSERAPSSGVGRGSR